MEKTVKTMQSEHYALREYVITLQSRLLEVGAEIPPPPPNVSLSQSGGGTEPRINEHEHGHGHEHESHEQHAAGPSHMSTGTSLEAEAVARAVAGLAAQEMNQGQHQYANDQVMKDDPGTQDTRTVEEINRHLQPAEAEATPASEG